MAGKHLISVDDFIDRLRSFERSLITRDCVLDLCSSVRITDSSLAPYVYFDDAFYTRNLIYRDELFEVMTICWQPGQKTAIHTHNGQLGWMTVSQGEVLTHEYHHERCNAPENQNVVNIDCLGGATELQIDKIRTVSCAEGTGMVTVDKLQTIHQIENAGRTGCIS